MNITLTRFQKTSQGIFSKITATDTGAPMGWACERAYVQPGGDWEPKVPPGEYNCVYGPHELGVPPNLVHFPTYEITNVPGHTGILFHTGNTELDSIGCVLVGLAFGTVQGVPQVESSIAGYRAFMATQQDGDTFPDFTLTVVDPLAGTMTV